MDNSNNRDVNPYVQRVDAPEGGADALRENYTQNMKAVATAALNTIIIQI